MSLISFTRFQRGIALLAVTILLVGGLLAASVPVHAANLPGAQVPPCHHHAKSLASLSSGNGIPDLCKTRCLLASPDHFLGFTVAGPDWGGKVKAAILTASSVALPRQVRAEGGERRDPTGRPPDTVPIYLRTQRLRI